MSCTNPGPSQICRALGNIRTGMYYKGSSFTSTTTIPSNTIPIHTSTKALTNINTSTAVQMSTDSVKGGKWKIRGYLGSRRMIRCRASRTQHQPSSPWPSLQLQRQALISLWWWMSTM
jgi:hypothetical protein